MHTNKRYLLLAVTALITTLMLLNFVSGLKISSIQMASDREYAILHANTDEVAQLLVKVSPNPDMSGQIEFREINFSTNHKVLIYGLNGLKTYYYNIVAIGSTGSKSYYFERSIYTSGRCNIGPNYGPCICGTGTTVDCGDSSRSGWFCYNSLCRNDLPVGLPDFTKQFPLNFTTLNASVAEPFFWVEVPSASAEAQLHLSGLVEPNAKINLTINGLKKYFTIGANGVFDTILYLDSSKSTNDLEFLIIGKFGKRLVKQYSLAVDTVPPNIENSAIPSMVATEYFNITGKVSEEVSFNYVINSDKSSQSGSIVAGPGDFNVKIPLYYGKNSVYIDYKDKAGNGQKLTRTPGDPRSYTQDIISDTKAPVFKTNNLNELSPTIVKYLRIEGKIEDVTKTKVTAYVKVFDDPIFEVNAEQHKMEGSLLNIGEADVASDGTFKIEAELPINLKARVTATANADLDDDSVSGGSSLTAEAGTDYNFDLTVVAMDSVGLSKNLSQKIKYGGSCKDDADWAIEFGDPLPEKLDPYQIEQGVAEIYIPFTLEYLNTDGSFPTISSPIYKAKTTLSAQNKKQFDWNALGSCVTEIVGSEGTITCKIKKYTAKDKDASSKVESEVKEATQDVTKYLKLNSLKIPTMLSYGYSATVDGKKLPTKQVEKCGYLVIQVDTDLINTSKFENALNGTINVIKTLENVTAETYKVLGTALQWTFYGYMGSGLGTVWNKLEVIKACKGTAYTQNDENAGMFSAFAGAGFIKDGVNKLLARPTESDKFNFAHGARKSYCEEAYGPEEIGTSDPKQKNRLYEACMACQTAINQSNNFELGRNWLGDRAFCPQVPTYQEFIRQRFITTAKAQASQGMLKGDYKDALVLVSDKCEGECTETNYGAKQIIKYTESSVVSGTEIKKYSKVPFDFECERYFKYVVNPNNELVKAKLFSDIQEDAATGAFSAKDTDVLETVKDSCIQAYFNEYNSACMFAAIGNGLYTQSRDYQINAANQMKKDMGASNTNYEQEFFKTFVSWFDTFSAASNMCSEDKMNNTVFKEMNKNDCSFINKLKPGSCDILIADTKDSNGLTSYGFLVKGSKVYFIGTESEKGVVANQGDKFYIGQSPMMFDMADVADAEDAFTDLGIGFTSGRIFVNKNGCAFTKRLTGEGNENNDIDTNPNFFFPDKTWTKCMYAATTPTEVTGDLATRTGLIGPLPSRVFNLVTFESGKKILYDPKKDFIAGTSCGCIASMRSKIGDFNFLLKKTRLCLEAAKKGGPIKDPVCHEFFSKYLCDGVYTIGKCFLKTSSTQGVDLREPDDVRTGVSDIGQEITGGFNDFVSGFKSIGDEGGERYGGSFTGMMDLSTKTMVNSACLWMLTGQWPDDVDLFGATGIADMLTNDIASEPLGSFARYDAVYSNVDKNKGYAGINYLVVPAVFSSAKTTRATISLVCSNDYSCSSFTDGKCDCLDLGYQKSKIIKTVTLGKRESFDEQIKLNGKALILQERFRYDKVVMNMSYVDNTGKTVYLPAVEVKLNYNNGRFPENCAYDSTYFEESSPTITGGFVCPTFKSESSKIIVKFVTEPTLVNTVVSAVKTGNDLSVAEVNGVKRNIIGLNPFTISVEDKSVIPDSGSSVYDPVYEAISSEMGYNRPTAVRYYSYEIYNDKDNRVFKSLRAGADTMLLVGDNIFGKDGNAGDLSEVYSLKLSDITQTGENLGTVSMELLDGPSPLLNPTPTGEGIVADTRIMIHVSKNGVVDYSRRPNTVNDAGTCAAGEIVVKGYCWKKEADAARNGNFFTIDNVRYQININLNDEKDSFYYVIYTKKVAFAGAENYPECESDFDFKLVFNIHNALADGSPDPVPSIKKELKFKARCFESGGSDSALPESNIVSTSQDCTNAGGSCKVGRTTCGAGFGSKIGTCEDGVCCANSVKPLCPTTTGWSCQVSAEDCADIGTAHTTDYFCTGGKTCCETRSAPAATPTCRENGGNCVASIGSCGSRRIITGSCTTGICCQGIEMA